MRIANATLGIGRPSGRDCIKGSRRRKAAPKREAGPEPRPPQGTGGMPNAHRRRPRGHQADRLADPQRLHRLQQDDDEPRGRGHRRRARRPPRRRLRLQLQRPLRPGRADPRALPRPHPRGRPEEPARRRGRQPRPGQGLGGDDDEREARRARRALGRRRHDRHGGLGRGREDRGQAAVPPARRAPRPRGEPQASSSTPPAATTTRARTTRRCAPRCAATSTAATTSSR